jgi:chromosome segregation ATPase
LEYIEGAKKTFKKLKTEINICNSDRFARLEVIKEQDRIFPKRITELESECFSSRAIISDLKQRQEQSEADFNSLHENFILSENDRAARLDLIYNLQAQLEKSDHECAARLEIIHDLQKNLQDSEADRADRLSVILDIEAKWQQTEADRTARIAMAEEYKQKWEDSEAARLAALGEISSRASLLQGAEADNQAKSAQIESLVKHLAEKDILIASQSRDINLLQEELSSLRSSLSWKITGPIRRIADLFTK